HVVQGQPEHDRGERLHVEAEPAEEHHEQDRQAAGDLDYGDRGGAQPHGRHAPPQREEQAQPERERRGESGRAQGRPEALDDERAPHGRRGLVLGRVPQDVPAVELEDSATRRVAHGEEHPDEDEDRPGDRAPQLAATSDGTGGVVEDRAHRANATFFSRRVASRPAGIVNTRYSSAIPPRIVTASPGMACPRRRPVATSSTTAKPAATEVFFASAMMTLIRGGITVRTAWGRITSRSDCPKVSPIARAASA